MGGHEGCCFFTRRAPVPRDYDTIETDDYSVDHSLNTISCELDTGGHMNSLSRSIKYEEDDDTEPGLMRWFICGRSRKGVERMRDDYTMVSQRGVRRTPKRVG